MNMFDVNIISLSGYTFKIKANWDISCMKDSICIHYDNKLKNDFRDRLGLELNKTTSLLKNGYVHSTEYEESKNYNPDYIKLIFNDEPLEQYHIECDIVNLIENDNIHSIIDSEKVERDNSNLYTGGYDDD